MSTSHRRTPQSCFDLALEQQLAARTTKLKCHEGWRRFSGIIERCVGKPVPFTRTVIIARYLRIIGIFHGRAKNIQFSQLRRYFLVVNFFTPCEPFTWTQKPNFFFFLFFRSDFPLGACMACGQSSGFRAERQIDRECIQHFYARLSSRSRTTPTLHATMRPRIKRRGLRKEEKKKLKRMRKKSTKMLHTTNGRSFFTRCELRRLWVFRTLRKSIMLARHHACTA